MEIIFQQLYSIGPHIQHKHPKVNVQQNKQNGIRVKASKFHLQTVLERHALTHLVDTQIKRWLMYYLLAIQKRQMKLIPVGHKPALEVQAVTAEVQRLELLEVQKVVLQRTFTVVSWWANLDLQALTYLAFFTAYKNRNKRRMSFVVSTICYLTTIQDNKSQT